jgi:hypothetical protein
LALAHTMDGEQEAAANKEPEAEDDDAYAVNYDSVGDDSHNTAKLHRDATQPHSMQ